MPAPNHEALLRNRSDMLALFSRAAQAPWLDRPYAPGKWTARQVLFHVADTESVILDRLRRGVADTKPLLWAFDQDEWAKHLAVPQRSLPLAAALFAACRDTIIDLGNAVEPQRFERSAVHSERGKLRCGDWFELAVKHAAHHVEQVEAIAAGRAWPS